MDKSTICILGGAGFVGRKLTSRLCELGYHVKIPTRYHERHQDLTANTDITLSDADIHNLNDLNTLFTGSDVVINLVGILNEKRDNGRGFEHAHVELTKKVVDTCKKTGIRRLLHMSALNADAQIGTSYYLRSKGVAEDIVDAAESEQLRTSIFRPSVIFGPGDGFFNRFGSLLKFSPLVFPLACPDSRFAPVYVEDVNSAFISALNENKTFGQHYNLCGPKIYTLKQLVEYTANVLGLRRKIIGLPDFLSKLQASMLEFAPGKPFSRDNYRSLQTDSICLDNDFKKLDITPETINSIVPGYLK